MGQPQPVRQVVVGYADESSDAALAWAAEEAHRQATSLIVVHAYRRELANAWGHSPWYADLDIADVSERVRSAAQAAGQRALELVGKQCPDLEVTLSLVGASTPAALVIAAEQASALVLGSRSCDRPHRRDGAGGSVAVSIAEHAPCLVVVVPASDVSPPGQEPPVAPAVAQGAGGVVVGLDDARDCSDAIGYGFLQAALRETWLTVVHSSWLDPSMPAHKTPEQHTVTADQLAELNPELARWSRRFAQVRVHPVLSHQPAAAGLRDVALDSQLLVVGNRGRGAIASRLLGSVSRRLVLHPPCPVAVVRDGQLARIQNLAEDE
jgi:nucleotide-binding universal stress UspA family protein